MAGLKYLMGVGRSPVKISVASWNSAAAAHLSGSQGWRNTSRRITPRAWARTATMWLCSWMFSATLLRIRDHRVMYFIREI